MKKGETEIKAHGLKTGLEKIGDEREEQIVKHGRTVYEDVLQNTKGQLAMAASILCYDQENCLQPEDIIEEHCPEGWDKTIWRKMVEKSYEERLVIAGAMIAAELDRLTYKGLQ